MIIAIFVIAILSCSYLAFTLGHAIGAKATSAYYVMVISYISSYLQDRVPHDDFLETCMTARNKTDQSIKAGKVLEP